MSNTIATIKKLTSIGYPGDLAAKVAAGKQLTDEEEQRVIQSCGTHLQDQNIAIAKQLKLL